MDSPRKRGQCFYCFSPSVMVGTFVLELFLALWLLFRHHTTRFSKTACAVLLLLATFQLAEYQICGGSAHGVVWARVGFVAITLLPLAGLYLVSLVSHKPHFLKLGYASAIAFVVYFLLVPKSITGAICGGNYVLFNTSTDLYRLYGIYYLGFLLLGVWESIEHLSSDGAQASSKLALQWLIAGYISFMAPMGVLYVLLPGVRSASASIMCGFAVLLALILTFRVVPAYDRRNP
jgi:hypothetical protein